MWDDIFVWQYTFITQVLAIFYLLPFLSFYYYFFLFPSAVVFSSAALLFFTFLLYCRLIFSYSMCVQQQNIFSVCAIVVGDCSFHIFLRFFFLYVHKMRQRKRNQNKFSEREKWKLTSIDFWSIFGDTCHFSAALSFCCVNSRTFSLNFTISRRFQH